MTAKIPAAASAALAAAFLYAMPAADQTDIRGFSPERAQSERELEEKARDVPQADADPRLHGDGCPRNRTPAGRPARESVADYALGLLQEWGFDVRIEEFEALLPYPTTRQLEMTAPVQYPGQARGAAAAGRSRTRPTRISCRPTTPTRRAAT